MKGHEITTGEPYLIVEVAIRFFWKDISEEDLLLCLGARHWQKLVPLNMFTSEEFLSVMDPDDANEPE